MKKGVDDFVGIIPIIENRVPNILESVENVITMCGYELKNLKFDNYGDHRIKVEFVAEEYPTAKMDISESMKE